MQEPISFTYPYSIETVMTMFRDRNYITKKHAQQRQRNIRILEAIDKPELYRLTIRRDIKALLPESIPDFAGVIVDRMSSIVTSIEWRLQHDGAYVGRNSIQVEGVPIDAHIDYWMIPDGGTCTHRQVMHAAVNIPLIRGQLEKFAIDGMRNIQRKDYEYNIEFLKTFRIEEFAA